METEAFGSEERWADFGNALRSHRKARGWSQKQMMFRLSSCSIEVYSQGTVSKWESGKQRPSEETVEVLEDIFALERGSLLGLLLYPVEVHAATERGNTNWIEDYEAKCGKLPPLPDPLGSLVRNYTPGQPVSKDMVVATASIQLWRTIKDIPGLEKKWREFLEWKGQDPDEYEYEVRRLAPPGGPGPIRLTYK